MNPTSRKKVLITGGAGFIGRALAAHLLDARHDVVLSDNLSAQVHGALPGTDLSQILRRGAQVHRCDVRDPKTLSAVVAEADVIVHLAAETGTAQSMYEIARYNAVNSQGTAELLDILVNQTHHVSKVILASSRSIYGEGAYRCPQCGVVSPEARTASALAAHRWDPQCPRCSGPIVSIPTPEEARPRPASVYAATKLAQEDLVRTGCAAASVPYTILRFQNVYGPGQSLSNPYTGILSIFSTRVRRGLVLPIFEDGEESRDFVHVTDVAKAIGLCVSGDKTNGCTFNVGSGQPTSIRAIAEMLVKTMNGKSPIEVTRQYRLGDIRHCYADMRSLTVATGFSPTVDLHAGMAEFAAWVSSQALPEDGLDRSNQELVERGLMR